MASKNNPGLPSWEGRSLKLRRISAGLTLVELAALLDVSKSTVSRWERGDNEPPSDHVAKLADILETPALAFARETKLV